jgi:hypothetical protein
MNVFDPLTILKIKHHQHIDILSCGTDATLRQKLVRSRQGSAWAIDISQLLHSSPLVGYLANRGCLSSEMSLGSKIRVELSLGLNGGLLNVLSACLSGLYIW